MSIVEAITRKPLADARDVFYACVTGFIPAPKGAVTNGRQLHSADIVSVGPTTLRIEARYYAGSHLPLIKHSADLYGSALTALAAGIAAIGDIPLDPWPGIFPPDTLVLTTQRVVVVNGPGSCALGAEHPLVAPDADHPALNPPSA